MSVDSFSKWSISIFTGILFIIFAAPVTFNFVQKYIGTPLKQTFVRNGVPTLTGLLVHGLLFALVVKILMG